MAGTAGQRRGLAAFGLIVFACGTGAVPERQEPAEASRQAVVVAPQLQIGVGTTLGSGAPLASRPMVATDGDGFVVTWSESLGAQGHRALYARVDAQGVVVAPQGTVLAGPVFHDLYPAVAYSAGTYVLSWFREVLEEPEPNYLSGFEAVVATLASDGQLSATTRALIPVYEGNRMASASQRALVTGIGTPKYEYVDAILGAIVSPGAAPVTGPFLKLATCSRCLSGFGDGYPYDWCERECEFVATSWNGKRFVHASTTADEFVGPDYRKWIQLGTFDPEQANPLSTATSVRLAWRRPTPGAELANWDPQMRFVLAQSPTLTVVVHDAAELIEDLTFPPEQTYRAVAQTSGHAIVAVNQDGAIVSDHYEPSTKQLPARALGYSNGYFLALQELCQKDLADAGVAWMPESDLSSFHYQEPTAACVGYAPAYPGSLVANGKGQLLAVYEPAGGSSVEVRLIQIENAAGGGAGGAGGMGGESAGGAGGDSAGGDVAGGAAGDGTGASNEGGAGGVNEPAAGAGGVHEPAGGAAPSSGTSSGGASVIGGTTSVSGAGTAGGSAGSANGGQASAGTKHSSGGGGDDGGCSVGRRGGTSSGASWWLLLLSAGAWLRRGSTRRER